MKFEKFLHRGQYHTKKGHKIRSKLLKWFCRIVYQCEIPFEADIDESVYFCHNAFGVVINKNAIICQGVKIQHSVTIGVLKTHEAPYIDENVFIGAHAMILGPVKIGKNSKIGAGSIVLTDVPPDSTVVGNPARVLDIGYSID